MPILNQLIPLQSIPNGIFFVLMTPSYRSPLGVMTSKLSPEISLWFSVITLDSTSCLLLLLLEAGVSKWTTCWSSSVGRYFFKCNIPRYFSWFLVSFPLCVCTYSVWTFFTHFFLGVSPFWRVPLMTSIGVYLVE